MAFSSLAYGPDVYEKKSRNPKPGPAFCFFSVDGFALHDSEDVLAAGEPVSIRMLTVGVIIPTVVAKGKTGNFAG
jgi:hypothetical protein